MTLSANGEKALHLMKQGFQVIPVVRNEDGSNNYNYPWKTTIVNSEKLVLNTWHNGDTRQVAILHPTIGVIDVDVKNGKDGFAELRDAGFELPDTHSYETKSGGRHYVVRFPEGTTKSNPVVGVDIQVGNGIAVWYGDVISDEELANIADAPAWAVHNTPEKPQKAAVAPWDGEAWYNSLPNGEASTGVERILVKLQYLLDNDTLGHQELIKMQYGLVAEAAKGGVGVHDAMDMLHAAFTSGEYDLPDYHKEWSDGLRNLVLVDAEAMVAEASSTNDFDADVEKAVYSRKVARTADKRIREENYTGTIGWDWEDLENISIEYTIDQLFYADSQNGLVGRSQLGKTHLLVSMMCHMALGLPWFNDLKVKKQKTLFIAGEGKGGIVGRFRDWCEAFGYTMDDIKPYIKIVTDVDLSLEVSLEGLKAIAADFKPDMVIMDTLSATTAMESENDATDMAEALANGRAIYPDSVVLWVHHPSEATRFQPDPKPRGSSVFKSNIDNMMTLTVDEKFQPHTMPEKYSNGGEVRYLALSTDDEVHGGKSKEGAPITISGLYLWEYKRGHVVMAQTAGEETHKDNIIIKKVFEAWSSKTISSKDFWAKAEELKLKDADDPTGGWTSQKSAERLLDKAETRGLVEAKRTAGQATMWNQFNTSAFLRGESGF